MISLRNLTRKYGDVVAVSNVSAEIQRGEIVGLLGHNGAGKTTVMKILTGYLDPTSGSATVNGKDVAAERTDAQKHIGYLPENAPLYDDMLVQEYLVMMAELRGVPADQINARVGDAVVATGLRERLLQPIGTLSKGLRQRVGIAQAILHKPDVLVLDEPTNGLDPSQIEAVRDLIKRLGKTTTIILSTHILQEVEAVCDRVLLMMSGQLIVDQPLAALRDAHRVRLVLAPGAADVDKTLARIPGVTEVRAAGPDTWDVRWHGDAAPVPAIAATAVQAGWAIQSVGPEQQSLEKVFQDLQQKHLASRGGAA